MDVAGALMDIARQEQADIIERNEALKQKAAAEKRRREEAQRESFEESWLYSKFPSKDWIIEERFDKISSMGSSQRFYLVHYPDTQMYFMMYGADTRTFSYVKRLDFRSRQDIWVMGAQINSDAGLAKYAHDVLLRGGA